MRATAPPEAPEGERLARLEAAVEHLIREVSDLKADGRDMRTTMNRHLLITIGVVVTTWLTVILAILFRM